MTQDDINRCTEVIVSMLYGPPSSWKGSLPPRWHLDRPCTPRDASMHDNGCYDAILAIRRLSLKTAEGRCT